MAKHEFKDRGMLIVVTLDEVDNDLYNVQAKPFPADTGSKDEFTLLAGIADIKFSKKSDPRTPSEYKHEKVKFNKPVTIEINFTDMVEKGLESKGKKLKDLELGYYLEDPGDPNKGEWHLFPDQYVDEDGKKIKVKTHINKNKKTGTVKFENWVFDPPVGWGFKAY